MTELRRVSSAEFDEIKRLVRGGFWAPSGLWLHVWESPGAGQLIFASKKSRLVTDAYHALLKAGYRVRLDRLHGSPEERHDCVVFEDIDGTSEIFRFQDGWRAFNTEGSVRARRQRMDEV